jgi:hypothetical protein
MLKLVLENGVWRRLFLIEDYFETVWNLSAVWKLLQLSDPLRSYAVPGVEDLVFLQLCTFQIVVFWISHWAVHYFEKEPTWSSETMIIAVLGGVIALKNTT